MAVRPAPRRACCRRRPGVGSWSSCLAAGPDGVELAAPAPVVSGVADTTGAGDAFNAGLVHALSDGASWPDALHAATRFASMIIARPSHERHRLGPDQGARFK
jgi:sugar/nucleoside kinase (ribokinase family)